MAGALRKLFVGDFTVIKKPLVRYGYHLRGKPPGIARTLKQRLEEVNYVDPSITFKVNIGFAHEKLSRKEERHQRLTYLRKERSSKELEKLARLQKLEIPLADVKNEWLRTGGPHQIRNVAEHYGIYQHLYGDAYFIPRIMLNVRYKIDKESYAPVHRGNVIKPFEASSAPEVSFNASPDSLWTLLLTNPDGNFNSNDWEYVHWFVGNIPGNRVHDGEVVWDYLQPFPPRGTGFHRMVFVLYRQEKKLDFSKLSKPAPCLQLKDRTFRTLDFYRELQDHITPAGLAFFQSDWDPSLTGFFHNTLNMEEPVYEYDFPKPYIKPQTWFPLRQPFNLYMDKYRDEKQIAKEFLLKKLKRTHPFKKPDPPFAYPNAIPLDKSIPSWLKLEMRKERLGWGRINDY